MAEKSLGDLMTQAQQEQLTTLLASIVENGWGTLEIVIEQGRLRWFRPQLSLGVCLEKTDKAVSADNAG